MTLSAFATPVAVPGTREKAHLRRVCTRRARVVASAAGPGNVWDRVLAAVPLSRVFGELLGPDAVRTRGDGHCVCRCPFHDDRTPSLSISDEKRVFYCFGCGAKGNLFEFERRTRDLEGKADVLRSLAGRFPEVAEIVGKGEWKLEADVKGAVAEVEHKVFVRKEWGKDLSAKNSALQVLRIVQTRYVKNLESDVGREAYAYMVEKRGLSDATLRAFGCGFAGPRDEWTQALDFVTNSGFSDDDAVAAGLATRSKRGTVYDIFGGRVVTPIRNLNGDVIAMSGRLLAPSQTAPKYVNSPETVLFRKKHTLFGIDLASKAESVKCVNGFVVVVEGYMDVISIFEHTVGKTGCVATMGTAASVEQITAAHNLLEDSFGGRVIINFDRDEPGIAAAERLCDQILPQLPCAHAILIAMPPEPIKDPDEYFQRGLGTGDEYIEYIRASAMHWVEWRGRRIIQQEFSDLDEMTLEGAGENGANAGQTSNLALEAEMDIEIDRTEGLPFDVQLGELMRFEHDEMLYAFGAPRDALGANRGSSSAVGDGRVPCSRKVLDDLGDLLASGQRAFPGLNAGALVSEWADALSSSRPAILPSLYSAIVQRAETASAPWREMSPQFQVRWMVPAPYVLSELPQRKREAILRDAGLAPLADNNMNGPSISEAPPDPRQTMLSMKRQEAQERHVLPQIAARRDEAAKMLKVRPRRAAEEMILRALLFASEVDRLDSLDKLLAVMVRCEENGLPFWTSAQREAFFTYLVAVEGNMAPEEMAAQCENAAWWTENIERLFEPIDELRDAEWKAIRRIELTEPVRTVECTAKAVESMASRVASRLAAEEMEVGLEKLVEARESEQYEEMDRILEKQISLKTTIDGTKFMTPESLEEARAKSQADDEKLAYEKEIQDTLAKLKSGTLTDDLPRRTDLAD